MLFKYYPSMCVTLTGLLAEFILNRYNYRIVKTIVTYTTAYDPLVDDEPFQIQVKYYDIKKTNIKTGESAIYRCEARYWHKLIKKAGRD